MMKPSELTNRAVILRDDHTNHKVFGTADSVKEQDGKLVVVVTLPKDSEIEVKPKKRGRKTNENTDSES